MARKSKQAGSGHMPLTHYERTKKFVSSGHGTTTTRLTGDSQTPFGHCSLGLTPIINEHANDDNDKKKSSSSNDEEEDITTTIAMVTPSGHLYAQDAILEYLLTKTQEYQQQKIEYERQVAAAQPTDSTIEEQRASFDASQRATKKQKLIASQDEKQTSKKSKATTATTALSTEGLKHTSYWLPDSQPTKVNVAIQPPIRPTSPHSGEILRRKDLRQVALLRNANANNNNDDDVLCAITHKPIRMKSAIAYWTSKKDKSQVGVVVLKDVYDKTIAIKDNAADKNESSTTLLCPLTGLKIRHTIDLHSSGSGFAAHNAVVVKTYKPTIT